MQNNAYKKKTGEVLSYYRKYKTNKVWKRLTRALAKNVIAETCQGKILGQK